MWDKLRTGIAITRQPATVIGAGIVGKKTFMIGSQFEFRGKLHTVLNIEHNGIVAKPTDDLNGPLRLLLPIDKYQEITGNTVSIPEIKPLTAQDYAERDIINKAELIRFIGGENGRQYIDRYIADGYNKIISIKIGAVNKWYLDNEKTGFQLPIGKDLRKYAELKLSK